MERYDEDFLELAERLDKCDREVSDWEAEFLESILPVLRAGKAPSLKQQAVLRKMEERYLE